MEENANKGNQRGPYMCIRLNCTYFPRKFVINDKTIKAIESKT